MKSCHLICTLLVLIPIALIIIIPDYRETIRVILTSLSHGSKDRIESEAKYISNERKTKPLVGKNCLVTGTSRGLGKSIAPELMSLGCQVYCAQREIDGMNTINEISEVARTLSSDGILSGSAELIELDLNDLEKVKKTVGKLISKNVIFDVVVLNAAVVTADNQYTKQGFEKMFGVYFVGHFLLLEELLQHNLIRNGTNDFSSRIIWISSESHRPARAIDISKFPNDTIEISYFTALDQYGYAKSVALMVAFEMGHSLVKRHISSLCYDPGPVATESKLKKKNKKSWFLCIFFFFIFYVLFLFL